MALNVYTKEHLKSYNCDFSFIKQTLFQHDISRKETMTCHSLIAEGAIQILSRWHISLVFWGVLALPTTFELKIYAVLSFKI